LKRIAGGDEKGGRATRRKTKILGRNLPAASGQYATERNREFFGPHDAGG